MHKAEILGISRHRMGTDGVGVTTLVGFYSCPLRCKYCLNPQSFSPDAKREALNAKELYNRLKCDDLYFVATGGGVTFGGGEPLLNIDFLEEFKGIVGDRWRITAETCLSVEKEAVKRAVKIFDEFIVDIKDTDPEVYLAYTGKRVDVALENLKMLLSLAGSDRIFVRLPLIKGYNTEEHRRRSESLLREIGVTRFDRFTYRVKA